MSQHLRRAHILVRVAITMGVAGGCAHGVPAQPTAAPPSTSAPSLPAPADEPSPLAWRGDGWIATLSFPGAPEERIAIDFRTTAAHRLGGAGEAMHIAAAAEDPLVERFELRGDGGALSFEIPFQGNADRVSGSVRRGTASAPFTMVRAAPSGARWLGGFTIPGDPEATRTGRFLAIDFDEQRATFAPDGRSPDQPLRVTMVDPTHVRFEVDGPDGPFVFDAPAGRATTIRGTVTHGSARGDFELTSVRPDAVTLARRYEGTFVAADGRTLRVSADRSGPRIFDASDGRARRLRSVAPDRFFVGPSSSGTYPWRGEVTFHFDQSAIAQRLVWRERDGDTERVVEAKRSDYRTEELRFANGDVTLAGTLYLPPGRGPHPAIVSVHGSDSDSRDDAWWSLSMARVFLSEGFAVLLYDKRGTGQSSGDYVPGAYESDNTSPANVERLAGDARAAAATLAARPDIDPKRVGLFGVSQAGWIMPLAAAKSKDIHFLLVVSGPTVPTSLEAIHSNLFRDGDGSSSRAPGEVDAWVQKAPRVGFDPTPSIAALDIPVLWTFGELDTSLPVPACLRALDALRRERAHDFEVLTFPRAGHSLFTLDSDVPQERALSPGMAQGFVAAIRGWLKKRALAGPRR